MTKDGFKKENPDNILLIDIRTDEEIESDPCPYDCLHIPMRQVIARVDLGTLPKDKKIVTVCRSGARCQMINQFLTEHGYQTDYIEGGIDALK